MKLKNKKTALIIEGGGQRGVVSFGITDTYINNIENAIMGSRKINFA